MRFNYINSMVARMNRAVGDAAEMTKVLDEPCRRHLREPLGPPDRRLPRGGVKAQKVTCDSTVLEMLH